MNTIIITSKNEAKTISRSIKAILPQINFKDWELIIVAPDKPTLNAAKKTISPYQLPATSSQPPATNHQLIRDPGLGKPAALNLAISKARGEILVLTDGDVFLAKNALKYLLFPFQPPASSLQPRANTGLVSGHPISINTPHSLLGFWSHLLTTCAHRLRLEKSQKGQYFDASGYLLAIKRSLLEKIPKETLAEDAYISRIIWQKGHKISYAPDAQVFVKFPTTYGDWLKQKIRSVGSTTEKSDNYQPAMRSFFQEIQDLPLLFSSFKYIMSHTASAGLVRHLTPNPLVKKSRLLFSAFYYLFFLLLLLFSRLHLWLLVLWKIKVRKLPFHQLWQPAKTTKN